MSAREEVISVAEGAAALLQEYAGQLDRSDADRKGGASRDLVSEADVASERYILGRIPESDDVLAEEGSERKTGARRQWIIDPLDGTVNFLHGLPCWCVSIALVEGGALAAAAIAAPILGETFSAARGEGAFAGNTPIRVSETQVIAESILATGFAYRRDEVPDHNFDNFQKLGMAAAGVRRMGSAAIDLALVAGGRLDGFWELHLSAWDVAAGILLIREAGGVVTDFHGHDDLESVLFARHIVAGPAPVHAAMRDGLHELRGF